MWEVFCFGYQPYFGLSNENVVSGVISGKMTLACPAGCPAVVYDLMRMCWNMRPEERVNAAELCSELVRLVELCQESGSQAVMTDTTRYHYRSSETSIVGVIDRSFESSDDEESTDGTAIGLDGYMLVKSSIATGKFGERRPPFQASADTPPFVAVQARDCTSYTEMFPPHNGARLSQADENPDTLVNKLHVTSPAVETHHDCQRKETGAEIEIQVGTSTDNNRQSKSPRDEKPLYVNAKLELKGDLD